MQSLSVAERRRLCAKSDAAGLRGLVIHLGAIVLLGWMITAGVLLWPLLMVLQGVLIVFLFTLLHETVHRTAFASARINSAVAQLCAFAIVLPVQWFRLFHFAHHRHTQDPLRDPELQCPKPETRWQYLKHISGLPLWAGQVTSLFRRARGVCEDDFVPAAKRTEVIAEARRMLLLYAVVLLLGLYLELWFLLSVWIVPLLLGQPFLRLYLLAEHGRCAFVDNVFDNTRTTISSALVRRLAWNMPYHTEHHAFPAVPFFRLPELHRIIKPDLKNCEPGYLAFHKSYVAAVLKK